MACVWCKKGKTRAGKKTVTLEYKGTTLVIKEVPAEICDNCGEGFLSEKVTKEIHGKAKAAAEEGGEVYIKRFKAA